MVDAPRSYRLELFGPPRLFTRDGPTDARRVDLSSRKGIALLALLATAPGGERTRSWLQERLWGSRGAAQAQGSLRRELADLRRLLDCPDGPPLYADRDRIGLDLTRVSVDINDEDSTPQRAGGLRGEFLEGMDLPGEESFEEWLREQRVILRERARPTQPPLPHRIVDLSTPPPGFDGRAALAVLPFANQTGLPENDYLVEGIGEDLIDQLSRLRWLPVIARSSSFAFDDPRADRAHIAAALGAHFLVEGRLRRRGAGFALAVTLSAAPTAQLLWSHRVDLPAESLAAALDDLPRELVAALDARIDHAQQVSAIGKGPSDLNISDLIWRGRWHLNRLTRADAQAARALFAEALAREPESPEALIQSAWSLAWSIWAERRTEADIREVRRLAQRAILADHQDGRGHWIAGLAECWLREHERSKKLVAKAIELNPSLFLAHAQMGSTLYLNNEPEAAIVSLRTALRLSANDRHVFYALGELAMAHLMLGDHGAAIEHADQAIVRRPAYWYAHTVRIAALVARGDTRRAGAAWRDLIAAMPAFLPSYVEWLPFADDEWPVRLRHALDTAAGAAAPGH